MGVEVWHILAMIISFIVGNTVFWPLLIIFYPHPICLIYFTRIIGTMISYISPPPPTTRNNDDSL